jgi:DNA-binding PucR family transcriptional regulator
MEAVRELAAALLPKTPQLSADATDHLFAVIPDLAGTDDSELWNETQASVEANYAQVLRLMERGASADALVVPIEATDFVHGLVRRGIDVAALLRSYRIGHAWLWDHWSRALHERVTDSEQLLAAHDASSAFMFAYVDLISDTLVEQYGSERQRLKRGAEQLRAETVRSLLAGDALDEEVAAARLGYELNRYHVAMHVSAAGTEVRGLERAARAAGAALGRGSLLVILSGAAMLDAWHGSYEPPAMADLEAFVPPDGIRLALGTPGEGVAGFRRSHEQAVQASRVALLARGWGPALMSYRDVELVSLLASDFPRAKTFVAERLGALGADSEPVARLRETVLAFLMANGSTSRVAKDLYVHHNTVAYRIKRAEELLGRPVVEDQLELACALTLAVSFGRAVLTDAEPDRAGTALPG